MQFAVSTVQDVQKIPEKPFFAPDADFSPEEIVPLALVRTHTKTDDIARVTDEQLILYRQSALESAEQYSGLRLLRNEQLSEEIIIPKRYSHDSRFHVKHTLEFPSSENYVYVIGPGARERVSIKPGTRKLRLPNVFYAHDFASCCNPCGNGSVTNLFKVFYRSGFKDAAAIPAGIKLGVLKYIAWSIENPGDVYMSVRGNTQRGTGAQDGTNNAAWASGALELWRQFIKDIT